MSRTGLDFARDVLKLLHQRDFEVSRNGLNVQHDHKVPTTQTWSTCPHTTISIPLQNSFYLGFRYFLDSLRYKVCVPGILVTLAMCRRRAAPAQGVDMVEDFCMFHRRLKVGT